MGLILRRELTDIRLESATIATAKEGGGLNEMNIIFSKGAEGEQYIYL